MCRDLFHIRDNLFDIYQKLVNIIYKNLFLALYYLKCEKSSPDISADLLPGFGRITIGRRQREIRGEAHSVRKFHERKAAREPVGAHAKLLSGATPSPQGEGAAAAVRPRRTGRKGPACGTLR